MTLPKIFSTLVIILFGTIGVISLFKGKKDVVHDASSGTIEIQLSDQVAIVEPESVSYTEPSSTSSLEIKSSKGLPEADRVRELFNTHGPKLPIVETVIYKSHVDWNQGNLAWLADYASHYKTSRHFIARSLNGRKDYFKQDVSEGDRFNVLRTDKNIEFYLLVDLSRSKMWFYYYDKDSNTRELIKTYQVGLGRFDKYRLSGSLTPTGKYLLGDKVAVYCPNKMGIYRDEPVEMIQVFGSRWIPFGKELSDCSDGAKGLGIHGLPWAPDGNGGYTQDRASLGKYESDGCVRLATGDVEELFAIIISRPTVIELVKDFDDAQLPGEEIGHPTS